MTEYIVKAINLPADPFVRAYLETAEWIGLSECAWCDECSSDVVDGACSECGKTLASDREAFNAHAGPAWSPGSLIRAADDCRTFRKDNARDLNGFDQAQAGHDFYLTRNGHGCGFWDGDYPTDVGKRLTDGCRPYGTTYECFDPATGLIETT